MTYDLELSHITKIFDQGGPPAVEDFNLQVEKGEFIALLGPSGCGKTTTLRMIGGFEDPTSGTVSIRGKVVNDLPPENRPTSMIFQNYALFPHMNVRENVEYGLRARNVPSKERRARVDSILEKLDLMAIAEGSFDGLSGGQKQRVALARGLVVEPAILLLDEPLGALDAELRKRIQTELRYLQRSLGSTFVFVTHAQSEAFAMADRIVVMSQGRIEQVAEPKVLYTRPRTDFVARFVGRNTIIPGSIKGIEGDIAFVTTEMGVLSGRCVGSTMSEGERVDLIVPAEVMDLYPPAGMHDQEIGRRYRGNCVQGTVIAESVVGSLVVYQITGKDDKFKVELQSHVDKYGRAFPEGTSVCIAWLPEDGHVIPGR